MLPLDDSDLSLDRQQVLMTECLPQTHAWLLSGRRMKIGELARKAGLRPSRIRYYEEIGLLKTVQRTPKGYRVYGADSVLILNLIVMAQKAGFSLQEIHLLVPGDLNEWCHERLSHMLKSKIDEIEAQEAQLATSKARLQAIRDGIANRPDGIDCDANARRILSLASVYGTGDGFKRPDGQGKIDR